MVKTIKLTAVLVVIGIFFTSCTQEETPTPIPQLNIQDFEGTYEWTHTPVTFELKADTVITSEGIETIELKFNYPRTLTNLKRVDVHIFSGLYVTDSETYGNVLLYVDPAGVKKLQIALDFRSMNHINQAIKIK